MAGQLPPPPRAERRPRAETWHGYEKVDDYHWLKAENWQEVMQDPALLPADIRAYLEAENAYYAAVMADTEPLQEKLFAELKGRIKEDDSTVPAPDGPFDYFTSYETGGQQPRFCRRPRGQPGPEEILLDGNALAKGREYFRFGGVDLSYDHKLIAWSFDGNGSEFFELRVRQAGSDADLPDVLHNTSGAAAWAADGKSFFYTLQDSNHRPLKTYRHVLGTPQSADIVIHDEPDTGMFTDVSLTLSGRFAVIGIHDHDTSECRVIDAARPEDAPRLIAPRVTGVEYDLEHWEDRFILRTNAGGAEDYKLVAAPLDHPSTENWVDVVPHRPGVFIVGFIALRRWLVRL